MSVDFIKRIRIWSVWSGMGYVIFLTLGVWPMAEFLPPPSPLDSTEQILNRVEENRAGMRLGMIFQMLACASFIPFTAVLTLYTKKVEGHFGVMSGSMLLAGFGNVLLTYLPAMWLLLALYRPELSVEMVHYGVDGYWLQFVGGITLFYPVLIVMAICAFIDKREVPLYPRWFGYFSLWNLLLFVPGLFAFFLYSGPFAWNGLLAFWLPLSIFYMWFCYATHYLLRAVKSDDYKLVKAGEALSTI